MKVLHVTKDSFRSEVLESSHPVLVDFFAEWCGPCRMLAPILDEIAQEREDIKVVKINVDEEPELASQYKVVSIPSVFVIQDGQVVAQSLGAKPKHQLLAMLP